jgi:hypothetical protein
MGGGYIMYDDGFSAQLVLKDPEWHNSEIKMEKWFKENFSKKFRDEFQSKYKNEYYYRADLWKLYKEDGN